MHALSVGWTGVSKLSWLKSEFLGLAVDLNQIKSIPNSHYQSFAYIKHGTPIAGPKTYQKIAIKTFGQNDYEVISINVV